MRQIDPEKNKRIKETYRATHERHKAMMCKVLYFKAQENKLSHNQKEQISRVFVEAKWFKNSLINHLHENNTLEGFDSKKKTVIHRDKDGNDIESELKVLGSQCKLSIKDSIRSNLKTLRTQKKNGRKVGRINFVKEVNSIDFLQPNISYKIDFERSRIKLQGIKGYLKINGLDQLEKYPEYELANLKMVRKPDGIYFALTTFIPKESVSRNGKTIGIDFGIRNHLTTSEGKTYNVMVQESDRLKKLQRKLSRQQKRSKRYNKTLGLIRIEYQKLTNKKNDTANKIVAELLENEIVVMQDENISTWKKTYSFGKTIQHSVLGRVKSSLMNHPNVVILNRFIPTTQFCPICGNLTKLNLKDRTYRCSCCDHEEDRDIHAAKNMIWFYENRVGVGRTKLTLVEIQEQIRKGFEGSEKREADVALTTQ